MLLADNYSKNLNEIEMLKNAGKLDRDPLVNSMSHFNEKLAELDACRERMSSLSMEANWNRNQYEDVKESLQTEYEIKSGALLLTDEISKLKSADLREAKVRGLLIDDYHKLKDAERNLRAAETYCKMVGSAEKMLSGKHDTLVEQIKQVDRMLHVDPNAKQYLRTK